MSFFFFNPVFHSGNIAGKVLPKQGVWKEYKKGHGHIEGVVNGWGIQTFCTLILRGWKGGPWSPELLGGPDLKGGTSDHSSYHKGGRFTWLQKSVKHDKKVYLLTIPWHTACTNNIFGYLIPSNMYMVATISVYIYIYIHTHTHIYIYIYVYVYICTCIYIHCALCIYTGYSIYTSYAHWQSGLLQKTKKKNSI